ncbi:MAG: cupredoxin domain-containing protein [Longimicrobiales bacterium]
MGIDVILVDIFALLTTGWIVWYFWLSESQSTLATAVAGVQESTIRVKSGYDTARIEVRADQPVRLTFLRQETSACSERVEFPDFGISRELPEGEEVTIELTPEAGEYEFTCQMGMLRGTLVARGNGRSA